MKLSGHGQARILSSAEIELLFREGLKTDRDRALFGFCLYTGCRIGEACSMNTIDTYDVQGVRSELLIRKGNTKGKQGTRAIPPHTELVKLLQVHRPSAGKVYLFPGRHGRGHINPLSADGILRLACANTQLVGVSTHSFRRTALTSLSNAGVPLRVIQEISGHQSLTALQKYLEVSEEQVASAIQALKF